MHKIDFAGNSLFVIAGRTEKSKCEILDVISKLPDRERQYFQLLAADRVFGLDHAESAFQKASRAFNEQRNVSDSLAFEIMLYMSGCRQLSEALELTGLRDDTSEIVCISLCEIERTTAIIKDLSLVEDDSLIENNTGKDLEMMGITSDEIRTVPSEKRKDLIMERVAGVDLIKR